MKKILNNLEWFFLAVMILCIIGGIILNCSGSYDTEIKKDTTDSIELENKIIIIEINKLDSIKNAKITEVKNLDNDSTLKLFYKLISE